MSAPLQPVSMSRPRGHAPRLSVPYDPNKPRDARYWTVAELAVVQDNFEKKGGVDAIARALPNRSRGSIYQAGHKLGLKAKAGGDGPRRRIVCTPALEQQIRERWPSLTKKGATTGFAAELGVPKHWLIVQATRMGLTRQQRKEPPWTQGEIDLMAKVPLHDPHRASDMFRAHGFNRTPTSIVVKAKRLNLSRRYKASLSATAAAKILGIDSKTITALCIDGSLKAEKRATKRLPQQGGDPWSIERAALRQYVIDNVGWVDIRKVDKIAFVDLLVNVGKGQPTE